jgi:hypothetical protein
MLYILGEKLYAKNMQGENSGQFLWACWVIKIVGVVLLTLTFLV